MLNSGSRRRWPTHRSLSSRERVRWARARSRARCCRGAGLASFSAAALTADITPERAGPLTEAFVTAELRKQLTWSDERPGMFHYRDHDGPEVDIILETGDGRIAAIEVKAAATLTARDFRWLTRLRDRVGSRFAFGVTLYSGQRPLPWGDRLAALPLAALWTA